MQLNRGRLIDYIRLVVRDLKASEILYTAVITDNVEPADGHIDRRAMGEIPSALRSSPRIVSPGLSSTRNTD